LWLSLAAALIAAGAAVAESNEPPGADQFPEGEGRDLTVQVCSACHGLEIVSQRRLDAYGWADVVQMMRDRGAQGSPEDMAKISAYLARAFPPS
jgi:mono/diheme cytochrome c family protein